MHRGGCSHGSYGSRPSFSRTLRLASTSAASAVACAASKRCRRVAYSGSVSQWIASAFKAASYPTPGPRGRGPSPWLRPWGLVAPPMSRRTCAATMIVARSASGDFPRGLRVFRFGSALWTPRVLGRLARGCGWGSWEGRSGAFLEPSVVGLSPPSSDPGFALSAPAHAPSAARGCPCSARALRGHGNAPSYPPNSLRHQGRSCGLCAPF